MYVLGLYSDGDYFKVSLISKKGKKSRIEFLKEFKKDTVNLNALKRILDKKASFFHGEVQIVSALNAEEIYIKKILIPFENLKKVKKALEFQLSSEEIYADENRFFVPIFEKYPKETKVTLYGFTKQAMLKHMEAIDSLGVKPEWISSVSRGIERFVQVFAKKAEPFFLFHLGWESSFFYYLEEEEIKREVFLPFGLKNIIDAIQKDKVVSEPVDTKKIANLFIDTINLGKKNHSSAVFCEIEKEISRGWSYILEEEPKASEAQKILFTGYLEFSEILKPHLPPIDFESLLITPHLEFSSFQINTYAIEIGLALDRIISDDKSLQLGQEKFTPQGQKRRAEKYLYRYLGIYLTSLMIVFFISGSFFMKKKANLKYKYESILKQVALFNEPLGAKINFNEQALEKNRKALQEVIKRQKQIQRVAFGPKILEPLMEWILFCKSKGIDLELSDYQIVQKPTEENLSLDYIIALTFTIKNGAEENNIEIFKDMFSSSFLYKKLYEKMEYYEDLDSTFVTLKVKI
jgi:hypothetical protein